MMNIQFKSDLLRFSMGALCLLIMACPAPATPVVPGAPVKAEPEAPAMADPAAAPPATTAPASPEGAESTPVSSVNLNGLVQAAARIQQLSETAVPEWPGDRLVARREENLNPNRDAILHQMLQEWDPALRIRALEGLIESGSPDALEALLWALHDADAQVRDMAAGELRRMADEGMAEEDIEKVYESVSAGLKSGDSWQIDCVDAALPGLAGILGERMLARFRNPETGMADQQVAAWCLGRMDVENALPLLREKVWNPDENLAWTCGQALLMIDDGEMAVENWQALLDHPAWYIRELAVDGLARNPAAEAGEILYGVAENADREISLRQRAVWHLAHRPGDQNLMAAIDLMEKLTELREYISSVLKEISGRDFGTDAGAWRGWIEAGKPPEPPKQEDDDGQPYEVEYLDKEE